MYDILSGLLCQLDDITLYMGAILQIAKSELPMKHLVIKLSNLDGVLIHYRDICPQQRWDQEPPQWPEPETDFLSL